MMSMLFWQGYCEKKIVRDGVVPEDFIFASSGYMVECEGVCPVKGIYSLNKERFSVVTHLMMTVLVP